IEGRTALTVLSKPIGRRQFVLGKFLGISWAVALLFVILGVWLLIWVAYKPIYDARESGGGSVVWQACFSEIILIVPGVVLAFMEVIIFVALSIAISTRLPITANFLVCFSIYVLGHLTPLMVQSAVAVEAFEPVVFIGKLIAAVIPVLDHFNIQAAIAADREVPGVYLGWTLIYCLIYSTIAMLFALVFFEDRDLT
ncbi:MAG: ABC transporter permease, partial [Planctomycetes bacterium]|nr:ABC transporter permease [Planctomycetota bacterium]